MKSGSTSPPEPASEASGTHGVAHNPFRPATGPGNSRIPSPGPLRGPAAEACREGVAREPGTGGRGRLRLRKRHGIPGMSRCRSAGRASITTASPSRSVTDPSSSRWTSSGRSSGGGRRRLTSADQPRNWAATAHAYPPWWAVSGGPSKRAGSRPRPSRGGMLSDRRHATRWGRGCYLSGPMRSLPTSESTRDGSMIVIRALEPDDKPLLVEGLERMSEESRYRRFLAPKPSFTSAELADLTEVDHHDHEALIAIEPESGEPVGVARYVRDTAQPQVARGRACRGGRVAASRRRHQPAAPPDRPRQAGGRAPLPCQRPG